MINTIIKKEYPKYTVSRTDRERVNQRLYYGLNTRPVVTYDPIAVKHNYYDNNMYKRMEETKC